VFDARMRKEQETISQERASRTSTGSGTGGLEDAADAGDGSSAGDRSGAGESGEGAGEDGDGAGGQGANGGQAGEAGSVEGGDGSQGGGGVGGGARGGSGPGSVPSDIPDGRDDDIVARQLREAAMKETDPELRERLWDEYRKYKQSTQ
jgi:hypothetical protein